MIASIFDHRRQTFEILRDAFQKAVDDGLYPLGDQVEQTYSELMKTPSSTTEEVIYKLECAIGEMDCIGGRKSDIELLERAITALQTGKPDIATRLINEVLTSEDEWEIPHEGVRESLADLRKLFVS